MAAKFPAVMIVRHVSQNPGISNSALIQQLAGNDPDDQALVKQMVYYCGKQGFLEIRMVGGVKTYELGLNEAWLAQHDLLPATKPKESTEAALATSQSESEAQPVAQQTGQEEQTPEVSLDGGDQSDAESTASAAESTEEPLITKIEDIPSFVSEPSPEPSVEVKPSFIGVDPGAGDFSAYGPFKVGYMSDGSITLHGLGVLPVELNKSQVEVLLDFMEKVGISWGNFELSGHAS